MARHYVIQDWQNAAEYSGEMIGKRLARSQELFLPNGKANIALFADEEPKAKKKKSVADSIDLAERHFQRMEKLSEELDDEYYSGEIDEERYELLRYKMDERLIKAFRRLEKENAPIWKKEDEKYAENSLTFSLDEVTFETKRKSHKSLGKTADKSLIAGEGWQWQAMRDCKENNLILVGICKVLGLIKKIKGKI